MGPTIHDCVGMFRQENNRNFAYTYRLIDIFLGILRKLICARVHWFSEQVYVVPVCGDE